MVIQEEAYKDLELCVGPENISREPAVLDGYAWQYLADGGWVERPVAVVLPASTEEVQAVVKACNRHSLKFKPFSTGWGVWGGCSEDNVVQIDLRRMNRIIEIDAKNMRAVIEPYVCGAQLQAEAWKVGLNTNIIGAGPNCSPLAAATSVVGLGHSGTLRATTPALVFRRGGSFHTGMSRNDSVDMQVRWTDIAADRKLSDYIPRGKVLDDMGDTAYCLTFENGTWAHSEQTFQYDPRNKEQVEYMRTVVLDLAVQACKLNVEPYCAWEPRERTFLSPLCGNTNEYQKQISKMMDPNEAADTKFYTKEEPMDMEHLSEGLRQQIEEIQKKYTWTQDGPPKR
ncbi:MAG: FAD-binding oxidoreductase [Methanomicrobiales archaeon]